ncbi:helix-turn-helix domain containing protein [Bacillus cereus]|nr:helix-turn-helix domain containing protein [Bacillus cereus]MDA2572694.1 helix-turn-helix domain containing protein [Bacillus cereus]
MVVLLKHREMKESRINIHIALEELNFLWDEKDIMWFRRMWNEGRSFRYMCQKLRRSEKEVLLLALDQRYSGNLKHRPGILIAVLEKVL